jgi:RNA polymerase sigma-70 factor (ECF subfamily)
MEAPPSGHDEQASMLGFRSLRESILGRGGAPLASPPPTPSFDELYESYVDFVWRSVRRLGVNEGSVDDAVQQVFLVVHRRLREFTPGGSVRTWIFGIVVRVVRDYRRSLRRKSPHTFAPQADPEMLADEKQAGADESTALAEAARLVQEWLGELDDDKREVFVLAELEQMTAQEIAEATGTNASTVYSRLRAARAEFEKAAERYRRRDEWRLR